MVVVFGLVAAAAYAGPPSNDLDPATAVKLVALRTGLQPWEIEVAYILDGNSKDKEGFQGSYVRRVTTLHPVPEGVSKIRRVVSYDFAWNDSLGWFMSQCRSERNGDAIYRWSERGGATVVK